MQGSPSTDASNTHKTQTQTHTHTQVRKELEEGSPGVYADFLAALSHLKVSLQQMHLGGSAGGQGGEGGERDGREGEAERERLVQVKREALGKLHHILQRFPHLLAALELFSPLA